MSKGAVIALIVAVLVLAAVGWYMIRPGKHKAASKPEYIERIREAYNAAGLPAEYGIATAKVESNFNPYAQNHGPGDGARGGAWGMFQMTEKTARALGFTGKIEEMLDFETALQWNIKLVEENNKRALGTVRDLASLYNSGKIYDNAPGLTRNDYIPKIERAYDAALKGTV